MVAKSNLATRTGAKTTPPNAIRPAQSARKTIPPKAAAAKTPPPPLSKLDQMVAAMRGTKGASVMDLMEITGWQMHSVRGAIAGALKKGRGLEISSKKIGETRIYRVEGKA